MTKVTLPTIQQPLVDSSGRCNVIWFEKFKFLEGLQPLSDVDFDAITNAIALKSDITRTINAQTGTTYTLVLADPGKYLTFTNGSAITATVPPNSSVAIPVGSQIDWKQGGAGKLTWAQGAGVTINSLAGYKSAAGQHAGGTLIKVATNEWDLVGSLIA